LTPFTPSRPVEAGSRRPRRRPPDEAGDGRRRPSAGVAEPTSGRGRGPDLPPLQDEIDEQLLPLFLEEALDLNQNIAAQLHAWRSNPADGEPVRRLARLFHTLKGSARMAGAMNLGELTHAIETRMQEAQDAGAAPLELIDDIDNAFDVIVQLVERLQRGETADTPVEISDAAACELADAARPMPVHAEAEQARRPARAQKARAETAAQRAILRVRADLIDRLVNEAGELSIARSRIEGEMRGHQGFTARPDRERHSSAPAVARDRDSGRAADAVAHGAVTDEQHADFDPLEFDRFTRFQELTRMMAESVNDVATVQQNLLKNLDDANAAIIAQARLNREVQQELMSVRMVPFGSIADRLYRIVRQAGKEIGKRANLEISGAQLELDRTVLDKMLAPLEHMLRNAIAHGLEDAPLRLAKGKPEIGEISLRLTQEGNEIILSFSDDGAGLDLDRLRQRGLHAGLLSEAEAADPAARGRADLCRRHLDRQRGVAPLRARDRHGCPEERGQQPWRAHRSPLDAWPGDDLPPLPAAHAGRHQGLAGPLRQPPVRHSVGDDRAGARPQGERPGPDSRGA
jgi:chemosensory pili system protein ChpA (sensor histidine kinase/response regulator)